MLALALTPNLGPKRIVDAIAGLECAAQIFALTLTELEGLRFPAESAQDRKSTRLNSSHSIASRMPSSA